MNMRGLLAAAGILALAGCGGETPAASTETATEQAAAATPVARDGCKDIADLAAAINEPEPFASLRSGNVVQGGAPLDDHFTTDVTPAGASCSMGRMNGFSDDSGMMYVVNCELFSSGSFDREENGVKAKEIFDKAKAEVDRCLPAGWTAREGNNNGIETTESLIYETAADIEREKTSSTYVYPVHLNKEWSDGAGRGQFPGWKVTLNFQKEVPKADTPAEPAQ
jgi:hypothetical protein